MHVVPAAQDGSGSLGETAMRVTTISRTRALWNKLSDKWQHIIGVLFVVLAFTLPIFVLALDNRCVQLTGHCH
jgi:hypothetical protein